MAKFASMRPWRWGCQVVEIAPAFGLDEGMRQQLHSDAVRLVKHVGYRNAGALASRQLMLTFS